MAAEEEDVDHFFKKKKNFTLSFLSILFFILIYQLEKEIKPVDFKVEISWLLSDGVQLGRKHKIWNLERESSKVGGVQEEK